MIKQYLVDRRQGQERRASRITPAAPSNLYNEKRTIRTDRREIDSTSNTMIFSSPSELLAYFKKLDIDMSLAIDTDFNELGHIKQVVLHSQHLNLSA